MKWYSEEELRKYLGHSITLPLLEQMEHKELLQCGHCPYWRKEHNGYGKCRLKEISYQYATTHEDDECQRRFAR